MTDATRTLHSATLAETASSRRVQGGRSANRLLGGLTLLAAAAAVVLAGATPSRADRKSDDIAKIIVGALVVGAIVNQMNDDNGHNRHKPQPYPVEERRPPRACAITIDGRDRRDVTLYGGNCLRDYGWRDLPRCGREMTIYGHRDRLYSDECLRRGY